MGFGATVENRSMGRSCTFLSFECGRKSFFDEPFADVGDGLGVAAKLFGDVAVGHFAVFVDGKQNIGVFNLCRTALASGNKFCERDTLFCCQGYFVYLLHGHVRVRGKMFEGKMN